MGLDLSLTPPPPPLTSFTGSRSRIPGSRIFAFLIRRQTERTTSIFGDRSSIAAYFVATFAPGGSTDTLLARVLIGNHFLNSPLCSCVSITLPASSQTRITASCERLRCCAYPIALLTAFGPAYHSRPNGSDRKLDQHREDLCADGLRKGAHFR